jgi:hypothetical protein
MSGYGDNFLISRVVYDQKPIETPCFNDQCPALWFDHKCTSSKYAECCAKVEAQGATKGYASNYINKSVDQNKSCPSCKYRLCLEESQTNHCWNCGSYWDDAGKLCERK